MTAPIIYKSTDSSAPTLTGQTGTLNALIKAILVDGYGSKSAAGWTRDYNDAGSSTACYRPAAGPRHYLQVADNGPGAGTYTEARVRGYVTMSAYNTGTEPFPTVAQRTNGLFIRKSATADATARAWRAVADDSTLYLQIVAGDTNDNGQLYVFGRFRSWKSSDAYETTIAARIVENAATFTATQSPQNFAGAPDGTTTCGYIPRSYSAVSGSVASCQRINSALANTAVQNVIGAQGPAYPSVVDGGILVSPLYVGEGSVTRGEYRGLWCPCHGKPILEGDTFTATDGGTSRTFEAVNILQSGQIFVETSNTWDTV